jgi:hypothetical protein
MSTSRYILKSVASEAEAGAREGDRENANGKRADRRHRCCSWSTTSKAGRVVLRLQTKALGVSSVVLVLSQPVQLPVFFEQFRQR